jgi:hypothetical protein
LCRRQRPKLSLSGRIVFTEAGTSIEDVGGVTAPGVAAAGAIGKRWRPWGDRGGPPPGGSGFRKLGRRDMGSPILELRGKRSSAWRLAWPRRLKRRLGSSLPRVLQKWSPESLLKIERWIFYLVDFPEFPVGTHSPINTVGMTLWHGFTMPEGFFGAQLRRSFYTTWICLVG